MDTACRGRHTSGTGAKPNRPTVELGASMAYAVPFDNLRQGDAGIAGGKGANLGEMTSAGFPVPEGFVVTVEAFQEFMAANQLEAILDPALADLDVDDREALGRTARELQDRVISAPMPPTARKAVIGAYRQLRDRFAAQRPELDTSAPRAPGEEPLVAVRSSATVEDSVETSYAGMFESFLDVRGEDRLIEAIRGCWASLFGERVLVYRARQGALLGEQAIAVVVQRMVEAQRAGVMFTADPTGEVANALVVESAWGLGEAVVAGKVQPDRFVIDKRTGVIRTWAIAHKEFEIVRDPVRGGTTRHELGMDRVDSPSLLDEHLLTLAELGIRLEAHYGRPQDVEFAVQGNRVYLVQTRPITGMAAMHLRLAALPQVSAAPLVRGLPASPGTATGKVRVLASPAEGGKLEDGEILVAPMTAPDWVVLMRRAAAIVTDRGGVSSHAAIISRELGVPCIVGTQRATAVLDDGMAVTVDATAGEVFAGRVPWVRPSSTHRHHLGGSGA